MIVLFILNSSVQGIAKSSSEFKGVWVCTVANMDYPSKSTTDSKVLKQEAIQILDNAKKLGFNAIILQVRPSGDAIYKSKIYPWSSFLTGTQGLAPDNNFDPLAFFIIEAHKRNLQLHAWINPYRVTSSSYYNNKLSKNNPAVKYPKLVVKHTDGKLYLNPGIPESRKIIIDGISEIIKNYNVDGIHLDDYFYPGKDFPDLATYKAYGKGYKNISDWRRSNNTTLIKSIHNLIHKAKPKMAFGVSPFGIWANNKSTKLGSATNGKESYIDMYADTRSWVKNKYLDYIAPQIYWEIGNKAADYKTLLNWWGNVVAGTGVKLYIGQASYKANNPDPKSPWYGTSELDRQIKLNKQNKNVSGNIMFRYKTVMQNN